MAFGLKYLIYSQEKKNKNKNNKNQFHQGQVISEGNTLIDWSVKVQKKKRKRKKKKKNTQRSINTYPWHKNDSKTWMK